MLIYTCQKERDARGNKGALNNLASLIKILKLKNKKNLRIPLDKPKNLCYNLNVRWRKGNLLPKTKEGCDRRKKGK